VTAVGAWVSVDIGGDVGAIGEEQEERRRRKRKEERITRVVVGCGIRGF
jgi:hypothetical protein